jgi:hypothetical protein
LTATGNRPIDFRPVRIAPFKWRSYINRECWGPDGQSGFLPAPGCLYPFPESPHKERRISNYTDMAIRGLKVAGWYARTLALNALRRGLILSRYTLACWQKQKVNRAMRRLGEQFFQALEQGETNPLVVSKVSDAVNRAKDLKEVKDKNYRAVAAIRERIRAAWAKESPPPAPETPPAAAEPTEEAEKPQEPAAS